MEAGDDDGRNQILLRTVSYNAYFVVHCIVVVVVVAAGVAAAFRKSCRKSELPNVSLNIAAVVADIALVIVGNIADGYGHLPNCGRIVSAAVAVAVAVMLIDVFYLDDDDDDDDNDKNYY